MSIEGIPDGWQLVRVGKVKTGEVRIAADGRPAEWNSVDSDSADYVIIRKIEKPKQFRPFANADEAESLWNAVLKYKNPSLDQKARYRIDAITKCSVSVVAAYYSYAEAFETYECIDGTPFGVEVTE